MKISKILLFLMLGIFLIGSVSALTWADTNLNDGLVSYWTLNESLGNALDSVGNNDGVIQGGFTQGVIGIIGDCVSGDGVDNFINFSNDNSLDLGGNDFSISVWVKPTSLGEHNNVWGKTSVVGYDGWGLAIEGTDYIFFGTSGGANLQRSVQTINAGWNHIVIVVNDVLNQLTFYHNGNVMTYSTNFTNWATLISNSYDFKLGVFNYADGNFFRGDMDELAIWNRVLSGEEITALYNGGVGLTYVPSVIFIFPVVTLNNPENYYNSSSQTIDFNCSATDSDGNVQNVSLFIDGELNYTQTGDASYLELTQSLNFADGTYEWTCNAYDDDNQIDWATNNFTFTTDTTSPVISVIFPVNNTHYNQTITELKYIISDASAFGTCWYSLDEGVTNTTIICGNNVTGLNAWNNGNYTWRVYANDTFGNEGSDYTYFVVDKATPILTWYYPSIPENVTTSLYSINVSAYDLYLDAVNVTLYNGSGSITHTNFTSDLNLSLFWINDILNLTLGVNTLEICARDSLEESPKIRDLTQTHRSFSDEEEFFDITKDGVTIRRTTYIINNGGIKVNRQDWNLGISDNWIDDGRHLKTTILSEKLQNENWAVRVDIECVNGCDYMELKTDNGIDRIIDSERTLMFRYNDAVEEGWDIQYAEENGIVSVIIAYPDVEFYDAIVGLQSIDPIVAGLNTICESQTITYSLVVPVIPVEEETTLYGLMSGFGAGLGMFFIYLSASLPVLLIVLAVVGIIIMVGGGVAYAIRRFKLK